MEWNRVEREKKWGEMGLSIFVADKNDICNYIIFQLRIIKFFQTPRQF